MCTWLFERPLPCLSLLLPQVLLPPLPDSCHGAWREFHGRSPVQLQLREHGQPGLCHTRHSFWRRRIICYAVERLQFLARAELFFKFTVFARAVCHFYTFLLGRGYSTIVEGQRLGTVHIMEGTCSRLRFFVKYYSARNQFERFRVFLELISRFESEFCRCANYFLKDSNFWCVHVNVPWPVCAHAIPFRMLWLPWRLMNTSYIYIYM